MSVTREQLATVQITWSSTCWHDVLRLDVGDVFPRFEGVVHDIEGLALSNGGLPGGILEVPHGFRGKAWEVRLNCG